MIRFCYCCGKESEFLIIKKTNKPHRYCKSCEDTYSPKQRKQNEIMNVFGLVKQSIEGQ